MACTNYTSQLSLLNPMILQDEYYAIRNGLQYTFASKDGDRILINCGIYKDIITYSFLEISNDKIIHLIKETRLEDFNYSTFQYDSSPYRSLYLS